MGEEQVVARRRWPWVAAGALALLAAGYAAFGYWGVPRLLHSQLSSFAQREYGRELALGEVRFDPFTFELEAHGFTLPDADGRALLHFDRLYVDFELLRTIGNGGPVFRAIEIEAPEARVVHRADGRWNVEDLAPRAARDAAPAQPGEPLPRIWIQSLDVRRGALEFADHTLAKPLDERFAPVSFTLTDFRTSGATNGYALTASSRRIESFDWKGRLALRPFAAEGAFRLVNLHVAEANDVLAQFLPFDVTSGRLSLAGTYRVAESPRGMQLGVQLPTVDLAQLALRPRGGGEDWVTLPSLGLAQVDVDLPGRSVSVGSVRLDGLKAAGWRGKDGEISLLRLLGPRAAGPAAPAGTIPAGPASTAAATDAAWKLSVADIAIAGATLDFEDRGAPEPIRLAFAPIDVRARGFRFPLAPDALDVDASVGVNGSGTLRTTGKVGLAPVAADLAVEAAGLQLAVAQPYVERTTALAIRGGDFGAKGRLRYAAGGAVTFAGDASIDGLRTTDERLQEDFLNWKRLDVRGIELAGSPFRLKVREVAARQLYSRIIIAKDGVLNVTEVLDPEGAARQRAAAGAAASAAAAGKARQGRFVRAKASSPGKKAAQPAPPVRRAALPVEIGVVRLVDSQLRFDDLSLFPNFGAAIEQLNGTIRGLSGREDARAEVKLDGRVDRYAPVSITGQVNYFAANTYTDVRMQFDNMELTSFSPYSGKFAGYRIDKGKLSVDLNYLIRNRRLDAKHRVVIDQIQLGEKVDSPDAVSLPVKLAIALLKDRNGVIDLDLPVSGTLDDPQFRIGPIVWKIVVNLFTKIVAAPFALLGSLFGGGDDIQFVDFAPGSATLAPAAQERLAMLRKGLAERPALNLEVPLVALPDVDRTALFDARWNDKLRAAAAAQGGTAVQQDGGFDALRADRKRYRRFLEALYRTEVGAKPRIPDVPEAAAGGTPVDEVEHDIGWLEGELKARVTVADEELEKLAHARAEAIQAAMLQDTGIDPKRVFVIRAREDLGKAEGGTVRLRLTLS